LSNRFLSNDHLSLLEKVMKGQLPIEAVRDEFASVVRMEVVIDEYIRAKVAADIIHLNRVLYALGYFLNPSEKLCLFKLAILDDWHQEHGELIGALQIFEPKTTHNLEVIKWSLGNLPAYITRHEDFKYPYVKKCMYAIGAQSQPEALIVLQEFQKSQDDIISSLAGEQLVRLSKG
jgi:hypothetical protein